MNISLTTSKESVWLLIPTVVIGKDCTNKGAFTIGAGFLCFSVYATFTKTKEVHT